MLLRGFWDSTEEGAWVASQISARVLAGAKPSAIAVLVRSQEQAKMLLPHLVAAGLPVAMQPQGTRGAWWEDQSVSCAVHALRLVRSTADDEAATLRAQLSLVHEKGVALRAQLVREQAARAGLERDLATSRAALEQSRAANAVLQAALDESKAALRRLGDAAGRE